MGAWKIPYGSLSSPTPSRFHAPHGQPFISLASLAFSWGYMRWLGSDWKYIAFVHDPPHRDERRPHHGRPFNLFVFMEIALLAVFRSRRYEGQAHEFEASFKYAVMGSVSSSLILIADRRNLQLHIKPHAGQDSRAYPGLGPGLRIW